MVKHTLRKAVNDCKEFVQYLKDMGEYEGARNWLKMQRDYEQALNIIESALAKNTTTSSEQLAAPAVSVAKHPLPRPLEAWKNAREMELSEYIEWHLEQERRGNAR